MYTVYTCTQWIKHTMEWSMEGWPKIPSNSNIIQNTRIYLSIYREIELGSIEFRWSRYTENFEYTSFGWLSASTCVILFRLSHSWACYIQERMFRWWQDTFKDNNVCSVSRKLELYWKFASLWTLLHANAHKTDCTRKYKMKNVSGHSFTKWNLNARHFAYIRMYNVSWIYEDAPFTWIVDQSLIFMRLLCHFFCFCFVLQSRSHTIPTWDLFIS